MCETEKDNDDNREKNKVYNGKPYKSDKFPNPFKNHAYKFEYLFHCIPTVVNYQRLSEQG